jgi:adenylate cyclase
MGAEGFKRKITAIMSSDVVGYSKLMGDDEAATVKTLEVYKSVMSALIDQHRGRVIDSPGDNMLSEFASVVDAVQCAVAIQKELNSRNAELPENRKMRFRIGINLGDVIQEEDRIYGDGVNIAARLEALADPAGICVSKTAFDHIETKLPLGYEFLGEQEVKNIAKPVGAYRVVMEPRVTVADVKEKEEEKVIPFWRRKASITGALAVLAIIIGVTVWQLYLRPPPIEPALIEKMPFALPDKPSIAVLPFDNLSSDPEQEYFSDGLTDEIIAVLSKVPKLFVIARNSTFTYKGKPVKVQQVSEELGVRYVLEGSVKKAGDKIRITAQLIDALSGHHLWAEQYDRKLDDIFAVQDEITKSIITAMQVKLTVGEQARSAARGTNNLEAYLKYFQANEYIQQGNIESYALARKLAEQAIALDPEYAAAYGVLSRLHIGDFWFDASKSQEQSLTEAIKLLQKAIDLDDSYAEAHSLLGWVFSHKGQHDKALAQVQKAVTLDPNSAESHFRLAKVLNFSDRNEAAILEYKIAIRQNPIPPSIYFWSLGLAYAETGQYDEGIAWCEKAINWEPDSLFARIMMAVVYSWSGRDDDARAEAAEVLRINPNFSLERFAKRATPKLVDALRKAGLK